MVNTKTLAAIEHSNNKGVYEVFMECEKTGVNYLKALDTMQFLNDFASEKLDINIINGIFSDVTRTIAEIGGAGDGK